MNAKDRVGFMQGRLSPLIEGRIQAFPWSCWQEEFPVAEQLGFRLMEWTLDYDGLYENPLLSLAGQTEIRTLCQRHEIAIPSLTGDCFMQKPFWKVRGVERETLEQDFLNIAEACTCVGISIMVVPLVDNGRLENAGQEDILADFLLSQVRFFDDRGIRVVFELDFSPSEVSSFIARYSPSIFGINYDTGNSAAQGFNPAHELEAYGHRIVNVHIKDRELGGNTVPLGAGSADFEAVFTSLAQVDYKGNYILQTARADKGNHAEVLNRYREMTLDWMSGYAA